MSEYTTEAMLTRLEIHTAMTKALGRPPGEYRSEQQGETLVITTVKVHGARIGGYSTNVFCLTRCGCCDQIKVEA